MKNLLLKASNNELQEMRSFLGKVNTLLNQDYVHIEEYISGTFLAAILSEITKVQKEVKRREF